MCELLNLRAPIISMLHKNCIFQCMGKIFCVEFQTYPLKLHTKYPTHTLKDVYFIHRWIFKSSSILELISVFETPPRPWRCNCLVTWFCSQLIAKPGNKTVTPSWPDHYDLCPVDSCVNLLSALDSRNGVMSMRTSPHLRGLLINNNPCGQQFS